MGGREDVSERDVPRLLDALRELCETFAADAASASYVSPLDGRLVTLHVTAHGVSYLADEDGNVVLVGKGALE
jgi:hypothetical protein